MEAAYVSAAEPIEFPTPDGRTAHAFYYAPRNPAFTATPHERAPLLLLSHGGPTTAARGTFNPAIQYWTTRGFAVADVNYSGSSGYGRAYRERLRGSWGVADVDDMVSAAMYLSRQRDADPHRLIIRGGSAGGYTALAALTFRPGVFAAAASYYGICDLELLARDTHKFEARYLDSLVGPYPDAAPTYRQRSPLHASDRLESALILFQGLEDAVVPPSQSELMANAARCKGLPVVYLSFEGEQHGFRRRDTIVRCLEAELYFYGRIFGFTPGDALPSVHIHNAAG
jgi:dipeptidyl aminopeptidase/acylaminoacyl peptidase